MRDNYEKEKTYMETFMIIAISIFLFGITYFIGEVVFNLSSDKNILFCLLVSQIMFLLYFIWNISNGGYYNG